MGNCSPFTEVFRPHFGLPRIQNLSTAHFFPLNRKFGFSGNKFDEQLPLIQRKRDVKAELKVELLKDESADSETINKQKVQGQRGRKKKLTEDYLREGR